MQAESGDQQTVQNRQTRIVISKKSQADIKKKNTDKHTQRNNAWQEL